MLVSQVKISAAGMFMGESRNVSSITDAGTGQRHILWSQAYTSPHYHVSVTLPRGRFTIVSQTPVGVEIHKYGKHGAMKDVEIDVLALRDA